MSQDDILVIGGGVIGVCAAYYLSAQGCRVTLVEKDDICAGCSYGNAGLIVPSHSIPLAAPGAVGQGLKWLLDAESPFYVKPRPDRELIRWLWQFRAACNEDSMRRGIPVLVALGVASAELFRELVHRDGLEFGYEEKGWLFLFQSERALEEAAREARLVEAHGIAVRLLDRAGVRGVEPNLLSSIAGGIYYTDDAHLVPDRFVRGLAGVAEAQGVRIKTGTEVLGFEVSGRRISTVVTTRGNFKPDQVVLAAGAWSPRIVRDLKLRLPIQAAKGYSLTIESPPTAPRGPLYLTEGKVAVTPMGDLLRFAGTLELGGLDMTISRRRIEAIRRAARESLPGLSELEPLEIWRGFRSVTPDGLPVIGRSHVFGNLIVACGHGMLGISHGPITGQLVSQIVTGQTPSLDLRPLRTSRFS